MPSRGSRPDVVSAGAVVLRRGQVLLVHRKRYDDWSFPKGKLDRGESRVAAAVREVWEETGVDIRLGCPLPAQSYRLNNGRGKLVHYWVGRVVGSHDVSSYLPNHEIDAVAWVPVEAAADKLTYPYDRQTLEDALEAGKKTWPLIVLRHAQARQRKTWKRDDRLRPLLAGGAAQSERLVPMLGAYGATRLVSSTSVRCVQTLAPYIAAEGLGLTTETALSEERLRATKIAGVIDLLVERGEGAVVCSHRPVLPSVFEAVGAEPVKLEPGSFWVGHHRAGRVVCSEVHHP